MQETEGGPRFPANAVHHAHCGLRGPGDVGQRRSRLGHRRNGPPMAARPGGRPAARRGLSRPRLGGLVGPASSGVRAGPVRLPVEHRHRQGQQTSRRVDANGSSRRSARVGDAAASGVSPGEPRVRLADAVSGRRNQPPVAGIPAIRLGGRPRRPSPAPPARRAADQTDPRRPDVQRRVLRVALLPAHLRRRRCPPPPPPPPGPLPRMQLRPAQDRPPLPGVWGER